MLFDLFDGFESKDFDVYSKDKGALPLYNRQRFMVCKKLEAIGERVKTVLPQCYFNVSHPEPSVWNNQHVSEQTLYFIRREGEQKKLESFLTKELSISGYLEDPYVHHNHTMIGLKVNHDGLSIQLNLSPKAVIDCDNLKKKLENESGSIEQLLSLFQESGSTLTIGGQLLESPDQKLFHTEVVAALTEKKTITFSYNYASSDELIKESEFSMQIKERFNQLKPLYLFINWSAENDHIFLRNEVKEKAISEKKSGLDVGHDVMILDGFFEGRRAKILEISKSGVASVSVAGIQTRIDATQLAKL